MNLCARLAAFFVLPLFFSSCKKDLGACTGNCEVVQFSGIAIDPGTQKPLGGLVVEVDMGRVQNCTFCGPYQVASGKTKGDGTFHFTVKVDTTKVINTYCQIMVEGPSNYLVYAQPAGPSNSVPNPSLHNIEMSPNIDSTGVATYGEFDFYQPVLLTLHLHRTTAIPSFDPTLGLDFILSPASDGAFAMNETPTNADTVLTVYTGANVFTKINSIQWLTDSTKERQTDSIYCVPGGNNTINIAY
ncbi:MAG TPA: hypothetical protein VKR41_09690 [Puia sp.]|nr:hypothetical protein [Puia sp.]